MIRLILDISRCLILRIKSHQIFLLLLFFIHKRLIASINSFTTAIDSTERQEITADMIVCIAAISFLSLSLQTENNLLIDSAKELMRKLK